MLSCQHGLPQGHVVGLWALRTVKDSMPTNLKYSADLNNEVSILTTGYSWLTSGHLLCIHVCEKPCKHLLIIARRHCLRSAWQFLKPASLPGPADGHAGLKPIPPQTGLGLSSYLTSANDLPAAQRSHLCQECSALQTRCLHQPAPNVCSYQRKYRFNPQTLKH